MTAQRRERLDRLAGRLAVAGAGLGVAAGLLDMAVGASIRDWVGNKLDTTLLGLGTVLLSSIALAAAVAWRSGGRSGGRRLATVLAFVVPAGVCFTTIGRAWYLPGVLLLGSAILVLATSTREELTSAVNEQRWLRGLTAVLGGYYVFLGFDALASAGVLGILGGLLVWGALSITRGSPRAPLVLLGLGALPFAVATWWSVVTPLIALLILAIGVVAVRRPAPLPGASLGEWT